MKKFKNSRLSTDSRKLQTLALKTATILELEVEKSGEIGRTEKVAE